MSLPFRVLLPTDVNRRRFGEGTPQRYRWETAPVRRGLKRMTGAQGSMRPPHPTSTPQSSPMQPMTVTRQRVGPHLNCYINAELSRHARASPPSDRRPPAYVSGLLLEERRGITP